MKRGEIKYLGIARAGNDQDVKDGYLDEAINARMKDGKRQPVGEKIKLYETPQGAFTKIWIHEQDNIRNFIGYIKSTGEVKLIDIQMGTSILVHTMTPGTEIDCRFIKKFLIIVSNVDTKIFMWGNNEYGLVEMPSEPRLKLVLTNVLNTYTEAAAGGEAVLGVYFEAMNKISNESGRIAGAFAYRAAIRMYDGSYVLHSTPRIKVVYSAGMIMREESVEDGGDLNDLRQFKYWSANLKVSINPADYAMLNKDVYSDVVIFASKAVPMYEISETTINDDTLEAKGQDSNPPSEYPLSVLISSMNEEFKELADATSFYRIHEISIEDIQAKGSEFEEDIDTKGFYQDYATREVLPADNFSHASISGRVAYNYNDRLILGATTTRFAEKSHGLYKLNSRLVTSGSGSYMKYEPHYGIPSATIESLRYDSEETRDIYLVWTLTTFSGDVKVSEKLDAHPVYKDLNGAYYFFFPEMIAYPDSRATELNVYVDNGVNADTNPLIGTFKLKASQYHNFAYYTPGDLDLDSDEPYNDSNYHPIIIKLTSLFDNLKPASDYQIVQSGLFDANRIQVSELQNPFVFPAKNSYQVGTGEVIGVAANTEPLSTGQFGEYPLSVFTSKGIYALLQGQGEVIFSNIAPVNGEVAHNKDQIVPLSIGVTYSTTEGLFLLQGTNITDLTQLLQGAPNAELQGYSNYTFRLDHLSLVQCLDSLSMIDAKEYILGAKVGFDKKNEELVVTNSDYSYSYVFSFKSNEWFKINSSFNLLVNDYPVLLGLKSGTDQDGVFTLSTENLNNPVPVLLTTRPCKLDGEEDFNMIQRVIQSCNIETAPSTYAGFYLFISNDLLHWQLSAGNDKRTGKIINIPALRTHAKAKYFIFVFSGTMLPGSAIGNIKLDFYSKLTNKLR